MKELIPVRKRPAGAMVFVLVTVVALLAAPMCAPLCAARACSSTTTQEQCHDLAAMGVGGEQFVAPGKTCRADEFSAVLSEQDEQALSSRGVRSDSAPLPIGESHEMRLQSLGSGFQLSSVHPVPLSLANGFLLSTILRF